VSLLFRKDKKCLGTGTTARKESHFAPITFATLYEAQVLSKREYTYIFKHNHSCTMLACLHASWFGKQWWRKHFIRFSHFSLCILPYLFRSVGTKRTFFSTSIILILSRMPKKQILQLIAWEQHLEEFICLQQLTNTSSSIKHLDYAWARKAFSARRVLLHFSPRVHFTAISFFHTNEHSHKIINKCSWRPR